MALHGPDPIPPYTLSCLRSIVVGFLCFLQGFCHSSWCNEVPPAARVEICWCPQDPGQYVLRMQDFPYNPMTWGLDVSTINPMNFREGERDSWGHTNCFARIFVAYKPCGFVSWSVWRRYQRFQASWNNKLIIVISTFQFCTWNYYGGFTVSPCNQNGIWGTLFLKEYVLWYGRPLKIHNNAWNRNCLASVRCCQKQNTITIKLGLGLVETNIGFFHAHKMLGQRFIPSKLE